MDINGQKLSDKRIEELIAIIEHQQEYIEELKEKETKHRWKAPENDMYRIKADTLSLQVAEIDKRLVASVDESKSARYIIGTSLFDVLRHPLHAVSPCKRIARCIVDKVQAKHHISYVTEANNTDTKDCELIYNKTRSPRRDGRRK